MNRFRFCGSIALWSLLALTFALTLAACDSNDDDGNRERVSGRYTFSGLTFVTNGSGVQDADVLSRIGNQEVRFFPTQGRLNMTFDYTNDEGETAPYIIDGNYDVNDDEVSIDLGDEYGNERSLLLVPDEFELSIDGATLRGAVERNNVDLSRFSEEIFGTQRYDGTLQISLQGNQ